MSFFQRESIIILKKNLLVFKNESIIFVECIILSERKYYFFGESFIFCFRKYCIFKESFIFFRKYYFFSTKVLFLLKVIIPFWHAIGLCLRSMFILNRKIELFHMSGSEWRCMLTRTSWNTVYQFYTVFVNIRICSNTRIWNFEIFFGKRLWWSRFLEDWNLEFGRILWKIPLSFSQIATSWKSCVSNFWKF